MGRSSYQFDRWTPRERSTWVFRVFKKHNIELLRMYTAFETSKRYTYASLGKVAAWTDLPTQHFTFCRPLGYEQFENMKDWSDGFNDLENWVNLNALVAISSNLETYLATVIPLALASDVGTLYGTSRRIDGVEILKHGHARAFDFKDHVIACTKGDWSSRLAAYEKYFGRSPKYFSSNISSLERIRTIRNNVAHAFGRDIDASRGLQEVKTLPIEKLTRDGFLKLQKTVWKLTKAIDVHLHKFHIGEYQALLFYHQLYPTLRKDLHQSMRAIQFKKRLGTFGATAAGKEYCKGLVRYYEAL
ncbi:hypothetical protein OI25_5658 [Paraburkholderia fungorum]|uniref:RiboL-PSP-HEPN domain-containing protein n=2 Tax=Paraburkholderia fungorum TaxID=134537 RepID=A0AAU8TQS7_9BURK|nr:hypothetical protein OI25_5658 [Paraburkholderia fungorum]PRZ48588.1 hypothetical protein BX589_12750 [Paraburkholderia fungorum]